MCIPSSCKRGILRRRYGGSNGDIPQASWAWIIGAPLKKQFLCALGKYPHMNTTMSINTYSSASQFIINKVLLNYKSFLVSLLIRLIISQYIDPLMFWVNRINQSYSSKSCLITRACKSHLFHLLPFSCTW